jgi:hypothetical protein
MGACSFATFDWAVDFEYFPFKARNHLGVIQFIMPQQVLNGPLGDTATTQ